ncbi:ATP-dependent DNA helicase RecG, partial [bacterium]|nr:ATP-dependent DNA helicase RecG [bacterium]
MHADEVSTKAAIPLLDKDYFSRFMFRFSQQQLPETPDELRMLLNNMNLAEGDYLRLAGLLLFGKVPQFTKPSFICKAIQFPGEDLSDEAYLDSEDFEGRLEDQFKGLMAFILRTLHKKP